ncbi:hypothetical protein B0A58_10970 [Flavobacterium branchiophilum NBRC 15030 = ATCC 35035]|uniref:Transposase IS200 family protein n=1 Tax=Flavobacterium branchiophilum TaxID=55197 RepID=A0A543G1G7_9FLAO|nr:transposase [Flavobacterium branchiophilum]OXA74497.1 hypothetical protein B0A58_10970 [Flavobacterium branchiophilum NBRC 15030 = ATCC 35035]TQM39918.1 transposase IS200 family protein [Flavobacterium branchiophilum]GEM56145.1 hypothetical protein FB1_23660 [Flavobacterium branchiophilum NBRC 15030 = ATCC 35035]
MNIREEIIEPDCFYHLYNRGINGNRIFDNEQNYDYFLRQFTKYVNEVCEVYAYCLMPNHFHFLIKVKSKDELAIFLTEHTKNNLIQQGLHADTNIVSKQIGKFISSYSQAYNKVNKRHGPLLESPFKRIKINGNEYLTNLILYIHCNPLELRKEIENYKYSSYRAIVSTSKTHVQRESVLEIFGGIENFIFCHNEKKV